MPKRAARGAPGKLRAVAQAWATGRGGGKVVEDDALTAAATLPAWMVKRREEEAGVIEIAEQDGDTVALFMALDTQWRHHAMTGQRLGLDYAAVRPTAELFGLELTPARMGDLRVMEVAALNALAREGTKR